MPEPKITTPPPNAVMVPYDLRTDEQPNVNSAQVEGNVMKVWTVGKGGHVCARLKMGHGNKTVTVAVMLPFGKTTAGEDVTIAQDTRLRVKGYLQEIQYSDNLARLFRRLGLESRILEADGSVEIKRTATYVIAQTAEVINAHSNRPVINNAQVEGIVAKTWKVKANDNQFARLAVYDAQCEDIEGVMGHLGHPRKKAHYCAAAFPGGKTANGSAVALSEKAHIMVIGHLEEASFMEALDTTLRRAGQPGRIADGDNRHRTSINALYVVARSMTKFTQ
jgi:hypothetical protein